MMSVQAVDLKKDVKIASNPCGVMLPFRMDVLHVWMDGLPDAGLGSIKEIDVMLLELGHVES